MTKRALISLLFVVAVAAPLAWVNRSYLDSFTDNKIGAPESEQTTAFLEPDVAVVVRLAVAGDVGTGGAAEYQTVAVMDALEGQRDYDALLLLGDNIYEEGDPADVDALVLDPFAPVLDGKTQLLAVLGNHDVDNGHGPAQAAALGMPHEWYSTAIGNVTIVALDSNQASDAQQLSWLESTLANTTTDFTIVIMHHPAYSAGWHGDEPSVQENFVPLLEDYKVDLVLSGHDHDYQRSKDINGVTYVVTGAAAKLRPAGSNRFTEVAWSTHSFVNLAVYPDRIEGQAVDHQSQVIDSFTIPAR